MPSPQTLLFRAAAAWTAIGLAGGLGYRELTRQHEFTGATQLAVVHTHALVLGTVVLLGVLALEAIFTLSADRRFRWFFWTWNLGLLITSTMLAVKGSMQVLGTAGADSPALAGISGTGHILLTVAFVLLFLALGSRIRMPRAGSVVVEPAEGGVRA